MVVLRNAKRNISLFHSLFSDRIPHFDGKISSSSAIRLFNSFFYRSPVEDSRNESNDRLWRHNDLHGIYPFFLTIVAKGLPLSEE